MKRFLLFFLIPFLVVACKKSETIEPDNSIYKVIDGTQKTYRMSDVRSQIETEYNVNLSTTIPLLNLLGIDDLDKLSSVFDDKSKYGTCVMSYQSVDERGKTVWLSGRLYYPEGQNGGMAKPNHIVMVTHHTLCKNIEAPSQTMSLEALYAVNGGLVVVPDLLGYGYTKNRPHPYCIPDLTARNVLDMVRAARIFLENKGFSSVNELPLYNVGYSQGGAGALAIMRYVQNNAEAETEFKLTRTYCGGGPYSIKTMMESYIGSDTCSYPVALPLILIGFKTAFPSMVPGKYEDYLSQDLLDLKIVEKILSKNYTTDELNSMIFEKFGETTSVSTSKLLNAKVCSPGNPAYEQLMAAAQLCEVADGWSPNMPLYVIHAESDDIVPYENFLLAKKNLSNGYTTFESWNYNLIQGHKLNGILFYAKMACGNYLAD